VLATQTNVTLSPEFSTWESLVRSSQGELFGKPLSTWQSEVRDSLDLPTTKPIVMVGHQPVFFHPGILSKFIAAHRLAQEIGGVLVFLVIDYHKGDIGTIETPSKKIRIANVNPDVPLNEQARVSVSKTFDPFSNALSSADGQSAAMQFAYAVSRLMSPWVDVHHIVPASALLQTSFGESILKNMQMDSDSCVETYNTAIQLYPAGRVPTLQQDELPIWEVDERVYPRAMLLTLLARLICCDLFVHGTGGMKYDQAMEHWCRTWLHCQPCASVLATADLRLNLNHTTMTEARRTYASPPLDLETKQEFLKQIEQAPYKSPQRQIHFQGMHRWLRSTQPPLDIAALREEEKKMRRRDWAFPLYPLKQLEQLAQDINSM